ncbi:MAG: hypothetical protein LH609_02275 [Rudanella sp.]|nr:hypothetical protein [Rudanella sp.]
MLSVITKRLIALCLIGILLIGIRSYPLQAQATPASPPPKTTLNGLETIENGIIKVGVDSYYGGSISYVSTVGGINMVNNFDLGRQFQIALYGGPSNFSQNGHPYWAGLGWNPLQAGDVSGNPAKVLAFEKQANLLYVKTMGIQFALNNVSSEVTIEHWVRLIGNVVKVHAKIVLNRPDKTQYQARTQEFPCLYVNGVYNTIHAYQGSNPYANEPITKLSPPIEMAYLRPVTEPWMAATDKNGFGIGLFVPYNYQWTKAFFGDQLNGGEFDNTAGYVANTRFEVLDHNLVHEWDYDIVVGNINDIRKYVYEQPRLAPTIKYTFDNSRKGWYYNNAIDTGWPIQNQLDILITDKEQASAKSPVGFWRGRDNKTLYLRAAFKGQSDKYRLHWRQLNDQEFYGYVDRYLDFPIIGDGQYHTYAIDLSQKTGWIDQDIIQIQLRPRWDGPAVNGWMKIESISTSPDANPITSVPVPPVTPITPPVTTTTVTPVTPATVVTPTPPATVVTPVTPATVLTPVVSETGVALRLVAPAYDCNTGGLTFNTIGGNGTTIEFMAVGITAWTTKARNFIDVGVRQDPMSKPVILVARQSGIIVSYTFDFRANCPGSTTPLPPLLRVQDDPHTKAGQSDCRCPVFTIKKVR